MKGSMGKVEASCILSLKKLYFCMSRIEKDNINILLAELQKLLFNQWESLFKNEICHNKKWFWQ